MTIEEAQKVLGQLKAYYPTQKPLDELTTELYLDEIKLLHVEDVKAAMKHIVHTSKFFPTIAEILEATEDPRRARFDRNARARQAEEIRQIAAESSASTGPRLTFAERMEQSRKDLEAIGVLPKMPTAKFVDTKERRSLLMAQAEQLKGESNAEWEARKAALLVQARELVPREAFTE